MRKAFFGSTHRSFRDIGQTDFLAQGDYKLCAILIYIILTIDWPFAPVGGEVSLPTPWAMGKGPLAGSMMGARRTDVCLPVSGSLVFFVASRSFGRVLECAVKLGYLLRCMVGEGQLAPFSPALHRFYGLPPLGLVGHFVFRHVERL